VPALSDTLRFWFGFSGVVDRRRYLFHGAALIAVKYAVDAGVVALATGTPWTPLDYLLPLWSLRAERLGAGQLWLQWVLVLWALPFLWIGVSMTMRRALDAGRSPWLCLLFFVPVVNYATMLVLCLLPTSPVVRHPVRPRPTMDLRLVAALTSIAAGLAVAIPTVLISVLVLERYTASLFLGTPFSLGAITAYVYNGRGPRSYGQTLEVVLLALLFLGGATMLLALEGLLCVAMAFPLAAVVAGAGAVLGRAMARAAPSDGVAGGGIALLVPLAGLLAGSRGPAAPPARRALVTAVEIAAPPARVWPHVVAFAELPEPTEWLFRTGVAYPQRARIDGGGVGAVRYCEFSTGAFVEPITVWDEPRRLAFDVVDQPVPMQEWSPYRRVYAAHLDGGFRARAGEFRLVALPGGRTRLEGTTWYQLDLHPRIYWSLYADAIVHAIHRRVLRHVQRLAEVTSPPPRRSPLGSAPPT
jgi:uncharacterized membrane protein YhaH (DUF805 family)